MSLPTRREAFAAVALVGTGGVTPATRREKLKQANRIKTENEKAGTTDWQLTYVKFDAKAKYRQSLIEGYCSRTTVKAGEKIDFFVSTDPASAFTIDFYRLGYYGGTGGRLVERTTLRRAARYNAGKSRKPHAGPVGEKRLRECQWEPSRDAQDPEATGPAASTSAKLSAAKHRYQSYFIFIVRDDRPADFLFQCSDNTWQAYNKWPENYSLYNNDRPDKKPLVSGVRVSFDRPYAQVRADLRQPAVARLRRVPAVGVPARLLAGAARLRRDLLLERGRSQLARYRSRAARRSSPSATTNTGAGTQFDHCLEAVKRGVNFGFLSGNTVLLRDAVLAVELDGTPNRIIERAGRYGGIRPGEEKWMADLPAEAPNEATLIGAQTVTPVQRLRRLDLHEAGPLDLRRHRHEEGRPHPRPRRLGVPRRPGEDPRPGSRRRGQDADRRRGGEPLHGDDLSRARRGTSSSTPRRSSGRRGSSSPPGHMLPYRPPRPPARPGRARAADHEEPAGEVGGVSLILSQSRAASSRWVWPSHYDETDLPPAMRRP